MLTITEAAKQKIAELVGQSENPVKGLRIGAEAQSPFKVDYKLAFIGQDQDTSADQALNFDGFDVFMDPDSAALLEEATVDYVEQLMGSGFKIDRPMQLPDHLSGPVLDQVKAVLEDQINPMVANHGGHIALLDIKDDVVFVELQGGCQGCGMADVTLKQGIETAIKEAVPTIKEVLDVTDHANGENPYYKSANGENPYYKSE